MKDHRTDEHDGVTIALDGNKLSQIQNEINLSTLLRVDAALNSSLLLRYGSRVAEEKNNLILDLTFFYQLLERVGVTVPSTVVPSEHKNNNGTSPTSNSTKHFEIKEQILLALLRLGADHKLYRLRLRCVPILGGRERVYFEVSHKSLDSSRIELLKRKWQDRQHQGIATKIYVPKSSSIQDDKYIHLIEWHRSQKTPRKEVSQDVNEEKSSVSKGEEVKQKQSSPQNLPMTRSSNDSNLFSEPYILPGMSLRERVRARAKHAEFMKTKRENNQTARNSLEKTNLLSTDNDVTSQILSKVKRTESVSQRILTSNSTLLRLADALRSYVRMKDSRSSAFGKQIPTTIQSKSYVHISFQELIIHLSGAVYGSFGTTKKRASKKEVTTCLITLATAVPKWLTVVRYKGKEKLESDRVILKVSKDIDYQSCVIMVLGGRVCQRKVPENTVQSNETSKVDSDSKNTEETEKTDLNVEATIQNDQKENNSKNGKKRRMKSTERNGFKKIKKTRKGLKVDLPTQHAKNGSTKTHSNKRHTNLPQSQHKLRPRKKKKISLPKIEPRVNENLRFCDADHDGVEGDFILSPTYIDGSNASPRGLQRLFSQLNSGKRI